MMTAANRLLLSCCGFLLLLWPQQQLQELLVAHASATDPRIIRQDELKNNNGVASPTIWLALMGKVFDVTSGAEYYGPEGAYHVFAGRDAPVPFVTGKFNEDEAHVSWRELVDKKQLGNLQHWIDFYATHSASGGQEEEEEEEDDEEDDDEEEAGTYEFVGYLVGTFYNEDGTPTQETLDYHRLLAEENVYYKEKRTREKEEREEKKEAATTKQEL